MAVHTVTTEEQKRLSDTLMGYRLRCCADPSTDSWVTVTIGAATVDAQLAAGQQSIAVKHDAWLMQSAKSLPQAATVNVSNAGVVLT